MGRSTAKCSNGEIGEIRIVKHFLPAPDELVVNGAKVTLSLSRHAVTFFKRAAQKRRVPQLAHPGAGGCLRGKAGREAVGGAIVAETR
jgi:hypothetical protein